MADKVIDSLKNKIVITAVGLSILTALVRNVGWTAAQSSDFRDFLHKLNPYSMASDSVHLMFTLFQMMIPFAEPFLRQLVNSSQVKHLNDLIDHPMQPIDALRVADACLAFQGYWKKQLPKQTIILSDKTGTLTTNRMDLVGIVKKSEPITKICELKDCFQVFASAFTHDKKESEPEEHAILDEFKKILHDQDCLKLTTHHGKNHFTKIITVDNESRQIETLHLGLYKNLGGRLTIVQEEKSRYLLFCGIPNDKTFHDMPLLTDYNAMPTRTGVLTRDWCIAATKISDEQFEAIKQYFKNQNEDINSKDKKKDEPNNIEKYLIANATILKNLQYLCTFLINNPLKKDADKFVSNFATINVPVIIATGDNHKAAVNIAKVLCPKQSSRIIVVHKNHAAHFKFSDASSDSTIVFAGINKIILDIFKELKEMEPSRRPAIIFSEMSADDKGQLAEFLKNEGHFVIANGDGTNDIGMMAAAHMVIAHLNEKNEYAPKVGQFANINDRQVLQLLQTKETDTFYRRLDAHLKDSLFINIFTPLASSQDKPTYALIYKSSKISFELMKEFSTELGLLGITVREMLHQHWFGIGFDLIFLASSFYFINATSDLPVNNQNLEESSLPWEIMKEALKVGMLVATATLAVSGESTNIPTMVSLLLYLSFQIYSLFTAFGQTRDDLLEQNPKMKSDDIESEIKSVTSTKSKYNPGLFGRCFRKKTHSESAHVILTPPGAHMKLN